MQAGVAQVCITPPIGVEQAGYGPLLQRRSRSVHDDLYAAALVLEDQQTRVAIVSADLISFDRVVVSHIRQLAAEATGIPADHILISCTHSHTSPTARYMRGWGVRDAEYVSMLCRQIAGAIDAANAARQPARIGWGQGNHPDLAWNRVHRDYASGVSSGLVDTSVQVLRVEPLDGGEPLAVVVNYACHPVMLGPHTAISADFPGTVRRYLLSAFPGAVVLFANGTCGDIDPVSNREVWGEATFAEMDRAGSLLAAEALRVAQKITLQDQATLAVGRTWADLPYQVLTAEQVDQELEQREHRLGATVSDRSVGYRQFWRTWARETKAALASGSAPTAERIEIQAIQIGDVVFLALPGEVFTAIGLAIKQASGYAQTFIVTFANGNVGYIATEEDYEQGGYGSSMAFAIYGHFQFETDVGRRLIDGATSIVKSRLR